MARISGEKLLSDQKIWEIVVNKAQEISREWLSEIESINPEISIAPTGDIYQPLTEEILLKALLSFSIGIISGKNYESFSQ